MSKEVELNFLLLGSLLLPSDIKTIIVNAINMVVLVMPNQSIKNKNTDKVYPIVVRIDIKLKGAVLQPLS